MCAEAERRLLPFDAFQRGEADSVSVLGLEILGPLGGIPAKDVDAHPQLPILQGIDPSGHLPLFTGIEGTEIHGLRGLVGIQLELALRTLAARLDGEDQVPLDYDLQFLDLILGQRLAVRLQANCLPRPLQVLGIVRAFVGGGNARSSPSTRNRTAQESSNGSR